MDTCDASGCLTEVCIQLAIIMIGKQIFNNFVEILSPKLWNYFRKRIYKLATKNRERPYTYWELDYQLQDPGRLALFDEYLEMGKKLHSRIIYFHEKNNIILYSSFVQLYSTVLLLFSLPRSLWRHCLRF